MTSGNVSNAEDFWNDLELDDGNVGSKDRIGVLGSRVIIEEEGKGTSISVDGDDDGLYEVDDGDAMDSFLLSKEVPLVKQSLVKDSRLHLAHRHELPNSRHESHAVVSGIIWALVILHLVGLVVWLRAWNRQRRSKDGPTMKAHVTATPPQKVACSYDLDKAFLPKIELPMKALNLKHSQA
jgi:hypothetical protein